MVLLPCGKCCGTCVCSCVCCACASEQVQNTSPHSGALVAVQDQGNPATEWRYYLTDPVPVGESVPAGVTRRLLPAHYAATQSHLPNCGITRRWPAQHACVSSAIAAEKAAIISAGTPYAYNLFNGGATSFSLRDRGFLLDQITQNAPGHALITGPVSLADEAAIDTYLATLFAGPLDLDQLHWGFCSEATDLAADDGWRLGWSTPYRSGEPLTPTAAATLCTSGSPRGHQVVSGNYVQTAWAKPFFWPRGMGVANAHSPPIQRIVLTGSTGNATDDSVLSIIGDSIAAEALISSIRAAGGPDYDSPVLTEFGPERPIGSALPGTSGEADAGRGGRWTVSYRLGKWNGARFASKYEQWTLSVTWRPCSAAIDNSPLYSDVADTFIHSYELLYYSADVEPPYTVINSDVTHLIASTADLWAYGSEQKCLGLVPSGSFGQNRTGRPELCSGTAYRKWFSNQITDGTVYYCHSTPPESTD